MKKHIHRFEALSFNKFSPNDVLKEFNMTTTDLDKIIVTLDKYGIGSPLVKEIIQTRDRGYRDLRKWKVQSFLTRYEKLKIIIDEAETIEDYLLEITDLGYRAKLDITRKSIMIFTKGVHKSRIDRAADVINFLVHLNKSHRLNIELISVADANEFFCTYNNETINTDGDDDDGDHPSLRFIQQAIGRRGNW